MSVISAKYVCDRDGTEAEGVGFLPPQGWSNLHVVGGADPVSGYLCPACLAEFVTFMQASGGGFSLSSPGRQMPGPGANAEPAEYQPTGQPSAAR